MLKQCRDSLPLTRLYFGTDCFFVFFVFYFKSSKVYYIAKGLWTPGLSSYAAALNVPLTGIMGPKPVPT